MKKENLQKLAENKLKIENPKLVADLKKAITNSNLGEQKIYGLFDRLLGFAQVFIEKNDGLVCRNVKSAIDMAKRTNQPSPLVDTPEQFDIMEIITINNDEKTVNPTMRIVMNVKDLIEMTN